MRFAAIRGTGHCVPDVVVTNAEVERRLGEPVADWLVENVGIRERRFMRDSQSTSDLATVAAREALSRAGIWATDLDLVLVATDTPDYLSPATASVVQHALGATDAATFDLNCACAGWVTALDVAAKFIAADETYHHVLVVGAYGMSRFLDWTDKRTCTLFADGAGAVVLGGADEPGYLGGVLSADGSYHDALGIYAGGARQPAGGDVHSYVSFARKLPASFNLEHWVRLLREAAAKAGVSLDEVALFLFTQLNLRTIEATMAALGYPLSRTHWTMETWGYTGSACIPMTLHDAAIRDRLRPGDLVAFCGSGGGVAMGASLVRWTGAGG